jgi:hypothetical protein
MIRGEEPRVYMGLVSRIYGCISVRLPGGWLGVQYADGPEMMYWLPNHAKPKVLIGAKWLRSKVNT